MSFVTSAEPDRLPTAPHPRETANLIGHREQERAFLAALRGRMHHAWLLGGPAGIGKATFAYRAARFMLAHRDPPRVSGSTLDTDPETPAIRRIASGAHSDLAVLRRIIKTDGKGTSISTNIPVESVRRVIDMFGATAAAGGWRVCIIDSAEDLDRPGANALLKVLEEPPPLSLFLIVSHAPGRLLPTIRSRCRILRFRALSQAEVVAAALQAQQAADKQPGPELARIAERAKGSVRRALVLAEPDALALAESVDRRLDRLPDVDLASVLSLGDEVAGRTSGEADFAIVMETIQDWLSQRLARQMEASPGTVARLAPLAEVWDNLARAAREAEIYNLDRRPLILSMFQDLSDAIRRATPA
jgi:DNA polymerase-3 subunit delta'